MFRVRTRLRSPVAVSAYSTIVRAPSLSYPRNSAFVRICAPSSRAKAPIVPSSSSRVVVWACPTDNEKRLPLVAWRAIVTGSQCTIERGRSNCSQKPGRKPAAQTRLAPTTESFSKTRVSTPARAASRAAVPPADRTPRSGTRRLAFTAALRAKASHFRVNADSPHRADRTAQTRCQTRFGRPPAPRDATGPGSSFVWALLIR